MFQIGGKNYEVLQDHKNGWNPEAFRDRYSEVLDRYDYIIGDWGYNQLRLKGFYRDGHPKANKDTSIVVLDDYINEYCNFGCAYFVLQKSREVLNKNESNEESISPDIQQLVDAQKEQAGTIEAEEQQEILQHTAGEREWTPSQQDSTITEELRAEHPREARESRLPREGREGNRQREARELRQPREPREVKDGRNPGEGQQAREPRKQRQQGNFDKKEARGSRFERQSKENREGRQSRVLRDSDGQRQAESAVRVEKAEISKKNKTFIAPQQNGS
ncbi:YutD family protein [Paenibacillus brasilensis]|uniref:Uncharacterized protein YutD n=1 Tax=Paenibacillus brasilensis TaxID=128574 RepID=A0ABU0L4U1_9BACL|nr:YutD family protein [Paenibacillus brasilensis]MDQ0496322.1 uncharacterized protein YutD [Paenibacillus brasilensis]